MFFWLGVARGVLRERPVKLLRLLAVLAAPLPAGTGCLIDTIPLPEDTPGELQPGDYGRVDEAADPGGAPPPEIDMSDIYHAEANGGVIIAGAEGAADGEGEMTVTNTERRTTSIFPTNIDGSFAAALNAAL